MKIVKKEIPYEGHILGSYYSNDTSNIGYINIPKNASSFAKDIFEIQLKFDIFNYKEKQKDKYIVILRDPYERWISGILEYISRYHFVDTVDEIWWASGSYWNNNKVIWKNSTNVLEFICRRIVCDSHTQPQVNFLEGLDVKDIIFLKVNEGLKQNLENFTNIELKKGSIQSIKNVIRTDFVLKTNKTENNSFKIRIKEHLELFLKNNPNYVNRIKNFYQPDYDLINSVKFYEAD